MVDTETERNKALEYRRKSQARNDARLAAERELAGSETEANKVRENTSALMPWDGWDAEERVIGDPK